MGLELIETLYRLFVFVLPGVVSENFPIQGVLGCVVARARFCPWQDNGGRIYRLALLLGRACSTDRGPLGPSSQVVNTSRNIVAT